MIWHSKPFLDRNDVGAIEEVISASHIGQGPKSLLFANKFAEYCKKRWGIAVQSGTDALILALKVLKLKSSAKIAIPAYACGAILDAVVFCGFTPIVIDISKEHLGIESAIVNKTKCDAVIAAHLFGIGAPFYEISNKNLIEDCAQCIGVEVGGKRVGEMGHLTVFSFYATKILTTAHGGMLCGIEESERKEGLEIITHDKVESWRPHLHLAMSDLNAVLGLSQFEKLNFFIKRRREIAKLYFDALGCEIRKLPENEMYYRFCITPKRYDLKHWIAKFAKAGIEVKKPVFKPIFKLLNLPREDYPIASWADEHLLSIPLYPALKDCEIEKICNFLRRHRHEISCRPSA